MKNLTKFLTLLILLISIVSCEKDEKVVDPKPKRETVEIEIGFPYNNQVFYSCVTNSVISTNKKDEWDLSFSCVENEYTIRLNVAKGMLAANTNNTDFDAVTSTTGLTKRWDNSNGDKDETAIGEWFTLDGETRIYTNNVYVIYRQKDINDVDLGTKKIVFTKFSENAYQFKYANLDGTEEYTYEISKDDEYNSVYFSFDGEGTQVSIEPKKNLWDLFITNFQYKFSNLPLPFVITGVLLNPNKVEAAIDSTVNYSFDSITIDDVSAFSFSSNWDKIGYEWKIINRADDSFTIDTRLLYIVKANNGTYYKIRFTDFYNKVGAKGYPTFEIEKL